MQNSNSLPWDTEHFKNKSIQRKIFDESVSYHLKGDDDNFDQSLVDNQTSFRTDNQISTNQIGYQDVQNQEQQPNSEIQLDKFQLYSQKSQFSHKLSENSDRNQQVGVINNTSKQKINETSPDSTIKNEKKNENTIFCSLDHQSNLHQVSNMSFNQKNSDLNGSYLSEIEIKNSEKCIQQQNSLRQIKPTQQPKKLSIYNYQKAADIIHNVIGKSANRVQRVDQQVKNFIAVLKSLKQNRRLPQLENEQFLNGSQEKRNSFYFLFNLTENEKHFIRLCNQLIKVISVAHFVSLSWYQLGSYEFQNGYQVSWLQKFDLLELTYLEKYVYSMYWSITTMTTAQRQYHNNLEVNPNENSKKNYQFQIQRYLNRKNVNIHLQSRVRHYLQFLAKEQKDRNLQAENGILKALSKKLRDEITIEVNQRILKNYSIFQVNFSEQTLVKLAFIMEELQISPNEIIFEQGDSDDQSVYLIESGIIEIYQLLPPESNLNKISGNNNSHILQQLKKKDLFGQISFFSGLPRKAYARSLNLSTLYKIDRNKFITILKENNEDFERFKMIEEQIKIQKDLSLIFIECYACKQQGHIASNCPILHQKFDSQFQILKNNFSIFQNRQRANRRKNKQNSKLLSQQNQDICKNLKNQLRNFNTIVEGYFKTELDFLAQISQKDVDKNEQEFQTSTEESSKSLEEEEDIQQYSIDQQQKETILQLNKQKSSIQMRTSEKQRVNSIIQNIENAENLIQNENEQIQNYQMIKNQQSTKTIPNGTFDYTQSKSFSNNEQTSECQKTDAENETFLEEINQGISNQDQLLPCIINSKTQMQKTNSNIKLASNLSSSEINQKVKKQEKNNSKQITYQSKKRMSYDDCQSSNLSDEETIKPIQNSTSKRKSNKNKLGTKKDLQDQISKTSFEILSSLNGNIFKNLVYQNSQNTIQTINTINMQDDAIDDFSKINQDQTHRNKYESNQHSSQQFKQNYSQRNVNFNVNQNDQNENNYVCKSLKVLGLPSQLISNVSNQKEILEQIQDILRKSRKDITSITKYSQRLIDEQQNYNNFSMNNFDKIQFYKRFFPHNNFSHIFNKFSFKKITELKKIRQVKTLVNKGRRNNILMTTVVPRKSLFCNIAQLQNNFPSEINIDSYKPTFLSYGVCCKDFQLYPKSYQNNIIQYEIQQEKQN
ncbi:hypothetical protein ABPG73_000591 [Tetrahymena malaccensis]